MDDSQSMKDDFLKELANIGLGNAATSLSQMVNSKVDISLPSIGVVPVSEIFTRNDGIFCIVMTGIQGDIKGKLLSLFSQGTSFWLIDKMSGNPEGTTREFNENGIAAMSEFANIIGGSFLTSLANFSHFNILPKLPETKITDGLTMRERFNDFIFKEVETAIYVRTEISIDGKKVEGSVYLALGKDSFEKMFSSFQ